MPRNGIFLCLGRENEALFAVLVPLLRGTAGRGRFLDFVHSLRSLTSLGMTVILIAGGGEALCPGEFSQGCQGFIKYGAAPQRAAPYRHSLKESNLVRRHFAATMTPSPITRSNSRIIITVRGTKVRTSARSFSRSCWA